MLVALLVIIWPSLCAYQHTLLSENLFTPLYVLSMALLNRTIAETEKAGEPPERWPALSLGLVAGLMYGVRTLSGAIAVLALLIVMVYTKSWRAILLVLCGLLAGFTAVLIPEFLWGKATMFHYAGREDALAGVLVAAVSTWRGLANVLERLGYGFLYVVMASMIVPVAAIACMFKKMTRNWKCVFLYCAVCVIVMVAGSALHCMAGVPAPWRPRYLDPFVLGVVITGLAAMVRMGEDEAWRSTILVCAGCLLIAWVPVETAWWMNTLAISYLRLLRYVNEYAPALAWIVMVICLAVVSVTWCKQRLRGIACLLFVLLLTGIDFLNAAEYERNASMVHALWKKCSAVIGSGLHLPVTTITQQLGIEDPREAALARQTIYFWTMGTNRVLFEQDRATDTCHSTHNHACGHDVCTHEHF